jgi:hypothetical protein
MSPRPSWVALQEREEVDELLTKVDWHALQHVPTASWAGRFGAHRRSDESALEVDLSGETPNQIPIFPAGADPDRYRRRPLGYLDRNAIERLIAGRAELIRPIAYMLGDDDFDRLRRVAQAHGRPLHALVSRPAHLEIDPREPYAIRFDGRVILAYCAWDGRELVVLQPPGHTGFARLKARNEDALSDHVVGQVVTLNWWEPNVVDSTKTPKSAT